MLFFNNFGILKRDMMNKTHLTREIKQHLNSHLNNIVNDVVLFGSQMSGTASSNSDYDILIVININDSHAIRKQINSLCYDLDLKYNIFLDTQIISEDELSHGIRGKHPIFKKAIREGFHA